MPNNFIEVIVFTWDCKDVMCPGEKKKMPMVMMFIKVKGQ